MTKHMVPENQIVLFPNPIQKSVMHTQEESENLNEDHRFQVVLSGSYRKDEEGLRRSFDELKDLGCVVLSPQDVSASKEVDGFVFMKGEENTSPETLETRHLDAILDARFVWLHAPDGYVGPSAALEIGFARASGIPVYCREAPTDRVLQSMVKTVESPAEVLTGLGDVLLPACPPALKAFQNYYRRAAVHRGYAQETARDCLLLMVEEVGELAHAIRQRMRLIRHGKGRGVAEGLELADVFLYVIHMANILDVDLPSVLQEKEILNDVKFRKHGS